LSGALLVGRLLLAAVFALAAVGKILDPAGSRAAVEGFGAGRRLARPVAMLLPIVELAIAVALIPTATARWAALAAVALLAAFAVAIAASLRRGEAPDCHCFGALGSSRAGPGALARTLALGAVAGWIAVAGPGKSLADLEVTATGIALAVLFLGLGALALVCWQLFRQNGRLLERVRALEGASDAHHLPAPHAGGLPVGSTAPWFELRDVAGRSRSLDDLIAAGRPVALAFSDPGCGACAALLPLLEQAHAEHAASLEIVLITRGDGGDEARLRESTLEHVLLQHDEELFELYRVATVPAATLIDTTGRIARPTVGGDIAIAELLASWAQTRVPEFLGAIG
jgi:uncharacterized membrane protein YphA (DoxX/SURF4 family)/thiol-disulfide isomerase/thioredoxin